MSRQVQWVIGAVLLLTALSITACQIVEPKPVYDGAEIFQANCATCHGKSAAGDGPLTAWLNRSVPDLRDLRSRNDGKFSELEVIQTIDGRGLRASHGSADMPVWGWAFREYERSESEVQARLQAVASYLESIQSSP
jgi:mono/diheme cytochrome c family protein